MMSLYKPKCIGITSGILIILLVLCWTGNLFAIEGADSGSKADTSSTGELIVIKKKEKGIVWGDRQRFSVSDKTQIFSPKGEKITYKEMVVPCKASILRLSKTPGGFHIGEIRIKKLLPGASANFSAPLPE
jgi:hypothetical protein